MENKISTSELRLGNWVYDDNYTKFPMQVETISKDYVYLDFEGNEGDVYECSNKEIKPIPLTKSFLYKINKIRNISLFNIDFEIEELENDICEIFVYSAVENYYEDNIDHYRVGESIKYVHQLQNLILALTGNELEIKREYL